MPLFLRLALGRRPSGLSQAVARAGPAAAWLRPRRRLAQPRPGRALPRRRRDAAARPRAGGHYSRRAGATVRRDRAAAASVRRLPAGARRLRLDRGDGRLVELVGRDHARAAILAPILLHANAAKDAARSAARNRPKPRFRRPARSRWFRQRASAPACLAGLARPGCTAASAIGDSDGVSAAPAVGPLRTRPAGRRPWPQSLQPMTGWFRTVSRKNANRLAEGISASLLSSSAPAGSRSGMQRGHASGVPVERARRRKRVSEESV